MNSKKCFYKIVYLQNNPWDLSKQNAWCNGLRRPLCLGCPQEICPPLDCQHLSMSLSCKKSVNYLLFLKPWRHQQLWWFLGQLGTEGISKIHIPIVSCLYVVLWGGITRNKLCACPNSDTTVLKFHLYRVIPVMKNSFLLTLPVSSFKRQHSYEKWLNSTNLSMV